MAYSGTSLVSIPHRKTSNLTSLELIPRELGFQFLIGRLVTVMVCKRFSKTSEFQFLIGRLVTMPASYATFCAREFQFLIGRLVTMGGFFA